MSFRAEKKGPAKRPLRLFKVTATEVQTNSQGLTMIVSPPYQETYFVILPSGTDTSVTEVQRMMGLHRTVGEIRFEIEVDEICNIFDFSQRKGK